MALYEFAVLGADENVLTRRVVELDSCDSAWPHIAELAWSFRDGSGQIRVKDSEGELVILTGVCAARSATAAFPLR